MQTPKPSFPVDRTVLPIAPRKHGHRPGHGTPVDMSYDIPFKSTGELGKVVINLK